MVSATEPNQEKGWKAHLLVVAVVVASVLFILTSAAPAVQTAMAQPSTASDGFQPEPTMNTNITWSTFHNGWTPLEYSTGSKNASLNAETSCIYRNPFSVNPADILSSQFSGPLGSSDIYWNSTYLAYGGNAGVLTTGPGSLNYKVSSSDLQANNGKLYWNISTAYIPSTNPAFDFVTIVYSSQQTGSGNARLQAAIGNGTTQAGILGNLISIVNETASVEGTGALPTQGGVFISMQSSDFVKNFNSGYMQIGLSIYVPETTSNGSIVVNTTILGLMLSSSPVTLGTFTNNTGQHPVTAMATLTGQDTLSTLSPSFEWTEIASSGYSAAVSQPMQNLSTEETSINNGAFTEQATYQGIFTLPAAPDLTYSNGNISVPLVLPGSQYEVANLNGASYLAQIQAKNNGSFTFATVNPTGQNSLVLEVEYTTAQWDASSSPPSFFSLAGLEYYWWATLIAIMGFVGLGGVALSHFGADEEGLRIPKGKFGR